MSYELDELDKLLPEPLNFDNLDQSQVAKPKPGSTKENRKAKSGSGNITAPNVPKKTYKKKIAGSYYQAPLEERKGHLDTIEPVTLPNVKPPPAQEIIPAQIIDLWEGQPWALLPDEGLEWYQRFEIYRRLPAFRRNLLAAYNIERQLSGLPAQNGVPMQWQEEARYHDWDGRARAFTLWDVQRRQIEEEVGRTAAIKASRKLLTDFSTKVQQAIERFTPEKVGLTSLSEAVKVVMQENRLEYGYSPAQKLEVTNMNDQEVIQMLAGMLQQSSNEN